MSDLASRITDPSEPAAELSKDDDVAASNAQVDGASAAIGGSALTEVDGDVEVTISGGDNNHQIYSDAKWIDLGLYARPDGNQFEYY